MRALKAVRGAIRRIEVPLYFVTFVLAVYLAGGNVLRAAKWPDEETWVPWTGWFVALLAAAVYVPLYAFYKALDAHFEKADKARSNAESELQLICQRVVSLISDACPKVGLNDLAASVWLCRDDGRFDVPAFFTLPVMRRKTGVSWVKGKGVAGMAWESDLDLRSDLRPLHRRLEELGDAGFDALPAKERHGLTAQEVAASRQYTGVCALRLFADDRLAAIFVIDYLGKDEFDCVAEVSTGSQVSSYLGGCEEILSAAGANL